MDKCGLYSEEDREWMRKRIDYSDYTYECITGEWDEKRRGKYQVFDESGGIQGEALVEQIYVRKLMREGGWKKDDIQLQVRAMSGSTSLIVDILLSFEGSPHILIDMKNPWKMVGKREREKKKTEGQVDSYMGSEFQVSIGAWCDGNQVSVSKKIGGKIEHGVFLSDSVAIPPHLKNPYQQ